MCGRIHPLWMSQRNTVTWTEILEHSRSGVCVCVCEVTVSPPSGKTSYLTFTLSGFRLNKRFLWHAHFTISQPLTSTCVCVCDSNTRVCKQWHCEGQSECWVTSSLEYSIPLGLLNTNTRLMNLSAALARKPNMVLILSLFCLIGFMFFNIISAYFMIICIKSTLCNSHFLSSEK